MTLLSDLKTINNQRIKPEPRAFLKVSKFIKGVIDNPADYQMDIKTRARIYSEESKKRITDTLEQVYHEIVKAENEGGASLNRLPGIAQYYHLQLLKQLSENNIDIKQAARNALPDKKEEMKAALSKEKKESPTEINPAIKLSFFQKQALQQIYNQENPFPPRELSEMIASYLPSHTSRVLDAAKWFQDWIVDNHKDDAPDLLRFLKDGFGFIHIYSYEEYLDLAEQLRGSGFAIPAEACDPINFAKQVISADSRIFKELPNIQPEYKYQILAEKLGGRIDDGSVFFLAVSWLASYEEYYDLVIYLQANHHELHEPKSVNDFLKQKALRKDNTRTYDEHSLLSFTTQEESRLQFVMEAFVKDFPHLSGATDNDKFLNFVSDRNHYPMVALKTYDQFCQSAKLICENHPHIVLTDPPCSPLQYAKLYFEIHSKKYRIIHHTDPLPVDPDVLTQLAAEIILDRLENDSLRQLDNSIRLISPYFAQIKSYEQYHSLMEIVSHRLGQPFNPPNVMQYMEAVESNVYMWGHLCMGQRPQLPNVALKANAIADQIVKETKDEKATFSNTLKYNSNRFINSYEEYCELGKHLKQRGFEVSDPICSKEEYTTLVLEAGSDKIPILPLSQSEIIILAVNRFQWWLNNSWTGKNYQHDDNFSELLLSFLSDKGLYYIKTYEDFCEFTDLLEKAKFYRDRGFKIEDPISPLGFLLLFQNRRGSDFLEMAYSLYAPELAKLLYMKRQAEQLRQSALQALKAGTFKNIKSYDEYRFLESVVYDVSRYSCDNSLSQYEFDQILENLKQDKPRPK